MFCTGCGHQMDSVTRFCPGCGKPVEAPPSAAPPPAPPPLQAAPYAPPAAQPPAPQFPQAAPYAPPAAQPPVPQFPQAAPYAPPAAQPPAPQFPQAAPYAPPYSAPPPYGVPPPYTAPPQPPQGYAPYAAPAPQWAPYPMVRYAGFWRRFAAYLIDGLLTGAAILVVFIVLGLLGASATAAGGREGAAAALGMVLFIVPFLVVGGWLYFALMESSAKQATLGKMAIGIKVTDLNGNRVSFGRATGRHFAKIVTSVIPLGIGWMLVGWTAKKQGIHDMMASCLVVCRE